jgi:nucleotide-binding universal stress UspA family protein
MEDTMKILIATDGSDGAKAAVADGLRLARRLDAEVVFVAVEHAQRPPFGVPPYYIADPDAHHYAAATIDAALTEARDQGVTAHGEVLPPSLDPAHEILEAARRVDADLIVVGSRRLGAIAGAILGSVSRSVVRHADRPVLVAKEYHHPETGGSEAHEHFFVGGGV